MPKITIEMDEKDARIIYINLRNHFVRPDDQRVVYDFVHLLDKLIDECLSTRQDVQGKLDQ